MKAEWIKTILRSLKIELNIFLRLRNFSDSRNFHSTQIQCPHGFVETMSDFQIFSFENYLNGTLMTFSSHSFSLIGSAASLSSESRSTDDMWLWQALMQTRGMRKSIFLDSNFATKQGNAKEKFSIFVIQFFFAGCIKKFSWNYGDGCCAMSFFSFLMGFYCVTFFRPLSFHCPISVYM